MINKKSRIIGLAVLVLWFLALSLSTKAQNVIRKGNTFVDTRVPSQKGEAKKTGYTYTDPKGVVDTIYISKSGKAFVWKTSKKTGKKYRKYLPEITKQLKTKSEKK